jgi:hypothetical protein
MPLIRKKQKSSFSYKIIFNIEISKVDTIFQGENNSEKYVHMT